MQRKTQAIQALIQQNRTLSQLQKRGQQLQQLAETIRHCLPARTAHHLHSCSYSTTTLTLYTLSAAQATALRLASHQLLKNLQLTQHSTPITFTRLRIRIHIVPKTQTDQATAPRLLTASTAALVSQLAETVIDPALKTILRRLSRRR